jgi:hypothetical protein
MTSDAIDPREPRAENEDLDHLLQSAREQEIRRRAYEIYLERGAQPGLELEDWLQAERELTNSPSPRRRMSASLRAASRSKEGSAKTAPGGNVTK